MAILYCWCQLCHNNPYVLAVMDDLFNPDHFKSSESIKKILPSMCIFERVSLAEIKASIEFWEAKKATHFIYAKLPFDRDAVTYYMVSIPVIYPKHLEVIGG